MKKLLLFLAVFLFAKDMPSIVSINWLKNHYNNKNLVIVDVREHKEYLNGHLKKAVNVPAFENLFDKKNEWKLPKLSFLKNVFSKSGIDDKSLVVVYGGDKLIWAARFYWISKLLGHQNVGLLRVSYRYAKNYLPVSKKEFIPVKKDFIPKIDSSILSTKLSTFLAIHKAVIIDGRPPEYYCGKISLAKRKGHIPTALNYPGSGDYRIKSTGAFFKDLKELKKLYKNLPKNRKIILYCQDGADAALNFIALKTLGYKDVSIYDGGWFEWGNDLHLPIEKGCR